MTGGRARSLVMEGADLPTSIVLGAYGAAGVEETMLRRMAIDALLRLRRFAAEVLPAAVPA